MDMATVGFIGSGRIGSISARLAVEAGHQVMLSNSRGPKTLGHGRGAGAAGFRGDE
jgi:8-hydroxy-5-deazaflavin:NADPH oxidoreductase